VARTLTTRSKHAPAPSWASLCLFLAAASARPGDAAAEPPAAAPATAGSALSAPDAASQGESVVAEVRIQRNRFIPQDTLLYYISTKAGDRYDETRLRQDF